MPKPVTKSPINDERPFVELIAEKPVRKIDEKPNLKALILQSEPQRPESIKELILPVEQKKEEPIPIIIENQESLPVEKQDEDMTAFKNTIAGKILGGIGKVVKPIAVVAGAVLGIGALSGVVKGVGAAAGVAKSVSGIKTVASKVTQSAVNLITGTTKEERDQVKQVTSAAKAAQDKLDQVERLVNAGASRATAMAMVGITPTELGAANSDVKDKEQAEKVAASPIISAGQGCVTTAILLLSSGILAFVSLILILF
jgi:hypothetical protein